jgi:phosphate-selective porin OprO/OprP
MRKIALLAAGLCLAATLGAVPSARAQAPLMSLYYQEVEKEGRVYVFNTPERFKSFSESGEVGTAITLVGQAEGGKTLIAENETAADLYFFKHNLPGYVRTTPKPYDPGFKVSWKDGKTSIESKSAKLDISNRIQIRFTQQDPEVGDDKGSFRIRRAKTKFEGWVYDKNLTYELQLNWPDTANPLEDVNVNYDLSRGKKTFQLKAGMFKVPFGRQELTSSGSQQFVDRALVSNEFARGRDIGLQLWGQPMGGKLDWRVGLFNGNGRTVSSNDNDKYQFDARLSWQPFGDPRYSESDFEASEKFLFAVAAQYESNDRHGATTNVDEARDTVGADVVAKYKGFSLFAEYFDADIDLETGSDFSRDGFTVQAGYFVVPQKFEVALRYAVLDPSDLRDNDDRTETGLALNYFFNKHPYKLQLDYRQLEDDARGVEDTEIRLQYQLIF